ncbi:hypothetical protein [Hyphomicrobium sp.]|jgi:hypothetical protein|uniref:hypothetical protein n=1 Tax=Hyphomicrobium sp. TaxID=82 RepID=UPI00356AB517
MRIDWNEEICGLPLLRVRHLLRRAGPAQFNIGFVIDVLGIKPKSADDLVAELMRRGWLEKAKPITPRRRGKKNRLF